MASHKERLVVYSDLAAQDREEIYSYTVHHWGLDQAELYAQLLADTAFEQAQQRGLAMLVEGADRAYAAFVKWPNAKYGHFIIFEYETEGIYVLRILHSAMNIPSHLEK